MGERTELAKGGEQTECDYCGQELTKKEEERFWKDPKLKMCVTAFCRLCELKDEKEWLIRQIQKKN